MAYAHSPNQSGDWHDLDVHLSSVAELAASFAARLDAVEAARLLGWVHDIGKLHPSWQEFLRLAAKGEAARGPDHSSVGMVLLAEETRHHLLALLCACHHGGLRNPASLKTRFQEKGADARIRQAVELGLEHLRDLDVSLDPPIMPERMRKQSPSLSLAWRMLHSCLVDADCLDTEAHREPEKADLRSGYDRLTQLSSRLEANQRALMQDAVGEINAQRAQMYTDALEASKRAPGFFSLTMPTGAGKTRTGMAFALRHALEHDLDRVIVAIPYTSIIEQNVDVYREMFGERNVLEHHSARVSADERGETEAELWQRLAADNWDAPVVVTTNVQFFESLFASRNSELRKLHNIAGSVVILDEVQTLPPNLLAPTLDALRTLVEEFDCTVVFSTATQPAFGHDVLGGRSTVRPLEDVREIVANVGLHFEAFRRVHYEVGNVGKPKQLGELADEIAALDQVLVIMNTIRDTRELVDELDGVPDVLHLSTRLIGCHRREVLDEVRRRLKAGITCRLISTQVVEAGVDLDFPVVYRALGPLDSVVQAAGRCNREGKLGEGIVHVFSVPGDRMPPGAYRSGADVTRQILANEGVEALHDTTVFTRYFRDLYATQNLDKAVCETEQNLNFEDSSANYRLIPDDTVSVLVRRRSDEREIDQILQVGDRVTRWHLRKLQPFLVSLPQYEFEKALDAGFVEPVDDLLYRWTGRYDQVLGVVRTFAPSALVCA